MHFMIRYFCALRAECIVIVKVQALLKKMFVYITNSIFSHVNTNFILIRSSTKADVMDFASDSTWQLLTASWNRQFVRSHCRCCSFKCSKTCQRQRTRLTRCSGMRDFNVWESIGSVQGILSTAGKACVQICSVQLNGSQTDNVQLTYCWWSNFSNLQGQMPGRYFHLADYFSLYKY